MSNDLELRDQKLLRAVNKIIVSSLQQFAKDYNLNQSSFVENEIINRETLPIIKPLIERSSKSENSNRESKIPRIKLPKVQNANPDLKQSLSSRNSKVSINMNAAPYLPRKKDVIPKSLDEIKLEGVQYSHCRSTVSASDEDIECLKDYMTPVFDCRLKVNLVSGYNGDVSRLNNVSIKNVLWIDETIICYPAACIVVVHDLLANSQTFFIGGHNDCISNISINKSQKVIAASHHGHDCIVKLWSYDHTLPGEAYESQSSITFPTGVKSIGGLSFSGDGKYLLVNSVEDMKSIFIVDWVTGKILCTAKSGHPDFFEATFDQFAFYPFILDDHKDLFGFDVDSVIPGCYNLISRSGRQLKFWTLRQSIQVDDSQKFKSRDKLNLSFTLQSTNAPQNSKQWEYTAIAVSTANTNRSRIFVSTSLGAIQIWTQMTESTLDDDPSIISTWSPRGKLLIVVDQAHDSNILCMDCIAIDSMGKLTTFDSNGILNVWNVDMSLTIANDKIIDHSQAIQVDDIGVRTIGLCTSGQKVIIGTYTNNILSIGWNHSTDADSHVQFSSILRSHNGKVRKVCVNPINTRIVATAGNDKSIKVWDSQIMKLLCQIVLEHSATALCFTVDGRNLVVGNEQGEVFMLVHDEFQSLIDNGLSLSRFVGAQNWRMQHSKDVNSIAGTSPY
jgi:WD40 repeat protein